MEFFSSFVRSKKNDYRKTFFIGHINNNKNNTVKHIQRHESAKWNNAKSLGTKENKQIVIAFPETSQVKSRMKFDAVLPSKILWNESFTCIFSLSLSLSFSMYLLSCYSNTVLTRSISFILFVKPAPCAAYKLLLFFCRMSVGRTRRRKNKVKVSIPTDFSSPIQFVQSTRHNGQVQMCCQAKATTTTTKEQKMSKNGCRFVVCLAPLVDWWHSGRIGGLCLVQNPRNRARENQETNRFNHVILFILCCRCPLAQ